MNITLHLLSIDTSNFWVVNWYYVSGITLSATALSFTVRSYYKKNKKTEDPITEKNPSINSNINPIISPTNTINVNVGNMEHNNTKESTSKDNSFNREAKIDSLKSKVKILFIDDDKKFNIVKILKDSKWKNTKSVVDIKSIDIPSVKEADILFVDVNGVGKLLKCEHEGLDIALMLKQKYPNKKIVIYSANKNNNFHSAWDVCDFKLEKNALSYQFLSLVEQYSLELYA
ncbi:hypothetical protein SAMN05443549_103275 [Flavobacterium fluvii]|uniref:Uncharacterized protein n=1 Tax=Flavobacterium fluvii TaxID=468056 RepID=A0A1M5IXU2_9FLAO|nr:hypothetical protein [Flavobacterium fluvii]SHG32869.1 hypothetical protein SAMN05443549_103275 [Flavobacterium fluvii]